jgi:hypothetical protein
MRNSGLDDFVQATTSDDSSAGLRFLRASVTDIAFTNSKDLVIWLFGYLVIWLFGYLIIWLFGYLVFGHADAKSFSHAPASLPGPAPSLVPRQNARPSAVIDTSDATAQSATTIRLVSSGVSESPSFISTALLVPLVAFSNCEQNTTSY